jgi:glycerol kinase
MWRDQAEISRKWRASEIYEPEMTKDKQEALYKGWQQAVASVRHWSGGVRS